MYDTYTRRVNGWTRPAEFPGNAKPSLWGTKGVLPNGINQGELGDCWFLAAAAALAEYPQRVHRMFYNDEYSADGVFSVTLYLNGLPVQIVVDDKLPTHEGKDERYTNFGQIRAVNA